MEIPFVGQAYQARSRLASSQRCVNFYLEKNPEMGRTGLVLYPTPGLSVYLATPVSPTAARVVNGRLFVTAGATLYEVVLGALVSRGTITNSGYALLTDNGTQLLVLTGGGAFVYNLDTGAFASSTSTYLSSSTQCTTVDGYGVFLEANSQRVRVTSPYDYLTVDPTDFASAEGLPDNAIGISNLNREVWILGERSTEIWFNSGATNFPFERSSNTFLEFGLAAKMSFAKLDGALYWIGRGSDGKATILRASGYQPEIIAHHGIQEILETEDLAGGINSAYAFAYKERGHSFYVVNLPSAERTLVYDAVMQVWHERSYLDPSTKKETNILPKFAVTWAGKTIVGTRSAYLCEMSENILTDMGQPIIRTRACALPPTDQTKVSLSTFELLMDTGIGNASGQGVDPIVQFRQSIDGGRSWGIWHEASAGPVGESIRRVIFRRLGIAVNRVVEVRVSDPVKWSILGATIDLRAK